MSLQIYPKTNSVESFINNVGYTVGSENPFESSQKLAATFSKNNESFETQKQDVELNLYHLKAQGCYRGEEKFFFGLITRKAEYTYYTDGKESIAEIKAKFGLKDGAISKCNPNIQDDDWIPPKDYEIFFYEEDANCQN